MITTCYKCYFEWFVEHVLTYEHLQQMDASLSYIVGYMVIYKLLFCQIINIVDDHAET